MKNLKPIELVSEQYQVLKTRLNVTKDPQEKDRLFRRLANLIAVMEFLVSLNKTP